MERTWVVLGFHTCRPWAERLTHLTPRRARTCRPRRPPQGRASAPHRPSRGCRQRQPLPPADVPLCHFSLATCLHSPCQTSAQPRPSSKPIAPKKAPWGSLTPAGCGGPDSPRPSRGRRARKSLSVSERSRAGVTCVQDTADHPWHDDAEHGQQLQEPAQDAAALHVGQVLPSQAALDEDLQRKRGGTGGFLRLCEPGLPLHRQDRTAGTCSSSRGCPGAGSGVPTTHPTRPAPLGTQGLRRHV